jgi:allantoicase
MKYLILVGLFSFNTYAQWAPESYIAKKNTGLRGGTVYPIKSRCEKRSGEKCHNYLKKNLAYYKVVNGSLVEDSVLKAAFDSKKAAAKAKVDAKEARISNAKANWDTLTSAQKMAMIKDLL